MSYARLQIGEDLLTERLRVPGLLHIVEKHSLKYTQRSTINNAILEYFNLVNDFAVGVQEEILRNQVILNDAILLTQDEFGDLKLRTNTKNILISLFIFILVFTLNLRILLIEQQFRNLIVVLVRKGNQETDIDYSVSMIINEYGVVIEVKVLELILSGIERPQNESILPCKICAIDDLQEARYHESLSIQHLLQPLGELQGLIS